jgi:glutamate-ammonia-ligase adenylyltransferase
VSPERLRQALATTLGKREGGERIEALRRFGQYEEVQIAIRDLLDRDGVDAVSSALTSLAEVSLEEALRVAQATAGRGIPMAVIAMGRFGGSELSYASDLDVMLVHDGETAADAAEAERVAVELRRLVNGATPSKQLWRLDLDLRPEGRQGPLARSLTGFAQYYDRWAQTWERQALLRGRFVAGDAELGGRFAVVAQAFLAGQVTEDDEREIRRMKARIERERIPPSDDPDFHLKLGRGGLADVEWTVQLLQLRHHLWGRTGTLAALGALVAAGHVSVIDAEELAAAYHYCERTRNRLYLVRGAPGDALPARHDQLSQLARSLDTTATDLRDDYRRVTRRCRAVVDRLFYGADGPPRRPRVPGGWPA